jgi:hypothetical protein
MNCNHHFKTPSALVHFLFLGLGTAFLYCGAAASQPETSLPAEKPDPCGLSGFAWGTPYKDIRCGIKINTSSNDTTFLVAIQNVGNTSIGINLGAGRASNIKLVEHTPGSDDQFLIPNSRACGILGSNPSSVCSLLPNTAYIIPFKATDCRYNEPNNQRFWLPPNNKRTLSALLHTKHGESFESVVRHLGVEEWLGICASGAADCPTNERPTQPRAPEPQKAPSVTLDNLVHIDAVSAGIQHPLVCGAGRDFPAGHEITFENPQSGEFVHAVFPEGVVYPKTLDGKFVLHGKYQGIQNRKIYTLKKVAEDYKYFVVSSWEQKQ